MASTTQDSANQESRSDARHVDRREIPVLDISDYLDGREGAKQRAAEELRVIAEDIGFGSVIGHGISQQLIDQIEGETKRFHDLSMEEKLRIEINQHQRGYVRPKATLIKHSTYAENKVFDLNGTLVMATEYEAHDPGAAAGRQFYAKNQWPEHLPGFKERVLGCYCAGRRSLWCCGFNRRQYCSSCRCIGCCDGRFSLGVAQIARHQDRVRGSWQVFSDPHGTDF